MRANQNPPIRTLGAKRAWRIAIFALAFLVLVGSARAFLAAAGRQALWQVVRACLATYTLTGVAFPCLKVNLTSGVERGYVVLRPMFGSPDTILTPTRKVVGLEDPWLRTAAAPNYFEAAWNARTLVKSARSPGREEAALAVNSEGLRGQDQLHIHIGCLVPSARQPERLTLLRSSGGAHRHY